VVIQAVIAGLTLFVLVAAVRTASSAWEANRLTSIMFEQQRRPWFSLDVVGMVTYGDTAIGFLVNAKNSGLSMASHFGMTTRLDTVNSAPPKSMDVVVLGDWNNLGPGDTRLFPTGPLAYHSLVASLDDTVYLRVNCVFRNAESERWYYMQQVAAMVPGRIVPFALASGAEPRIAPGAAWPCGVYYGGATVMPDSSFRIRMTKLQP